MSDGKDLDKILKGMVAQNFRSPLYEISQHMNHMSRMAKGVVSSMAKDMLPVLHELKELKEIYEQYEEVIERSDEWEEITGLTIEELDEMEIIEALEYVKEKMLEQPASIPSTRYPKNVVIPKDKVSNSFFNNEIPEGVIQPVGTERKSSRKELTAKVSIDFGELEGVAISKNITPYDREVHDAIVSLYIDGENDYITPLMIYRAMTGNSKAKLNPKQQQAIKDSVTKCSMTRIRIDAKEEADSYKMDKLIYEGNLIYTKMVSGTHKGKTSDWIYIMERPVLYDYANSKGQIARAEIGLLDTPVSKNEETIILQGYLLKRILTMQNSKMSRNILYETVYKQLDIQAASKASLDNKRKKIRDSSKKILDDWKEKKFIKGYKENKGPKNSIVSLTILID